MAALQRAVAAAEPERVAMAVGEHLDLDMARVHAGISRCRPRGLPKARRASSRVSAQRVQQCGFALHDPHAAPAAAAGCLEDDRVADLACQRRARRRGRQAARCRTRARRARPAARIARFAATLSPIVRMQAALGPDKGQAGLASTRSAKSAFSDRNP